MRLVLDNKKLKLTRLLKGMTAVGLARKSGISEDALFKIEKGERSPRPDTIKKLADALDVQVGDIAEVVGLDGTGESNTHSSTSTEQRATG